MSNRIDINRDWGLQNRHSQYPDGSFVTFIQAVFLRPGHVSVINTLTGPVIGCEAKPVDAPAGMPASEHYKVPVITLEEGEARLAEFAASLPPDWCANCDKRFHNWTPAYDELYVVPEDDMYHVPRLERDGTCPVCLRVDAEGTYAALVPPQKAKVPPSDHYPDCPF